MIEELRPTSDCVPKDQTRLRWAALGKRYDPKPNCRTSFALLTAIGVISCAVLADAQSPSGVPPPTPSIYSVDPEAGMPGTKVTIIGFGFAASNTVHFGDATVPNVPISQSVGIMCVPNAPQCHSGVNQTLVITVPAAAKAGSYSLSVENANGVSNRVTFVVRNAP
jgi:hypothetical protein